MTDHLTAGISGAELIRRRQAHLCVGCGFRRVQAVSESGELPYLCQRCQDSLPPKPKFNYKRHREDGIANLKRWDADDAS
jgi:hypothetical protein